MRKTDERSKERRKYVACRGTALQCVLLYRGLVAGCWSLLVVAVTPVGLCDAMRQVLKLCRDAITTRDQVLSGAEESRGRYEPPANTAVPLRVLGWRGSFQWGKLLGGAAGEGGPSCKRTVAKGWLKRREIDLESKEPFMMNGRGWIEGKVVESNKVGRASAEEQASRDPNGTQ